MSHDDSPTHRDPLTRFVPIELLRKLAPDDLGAIDRVQSVGEPASILFADIRGFTALSETLSNRELLSFLNRIFERICPPIYAHHGIVDKFIGDAVMAIFTSDSATADNAVQAAVDMQLAMDKVHDGLLDGRRIEIGVGIHTGEIIIGTVGYDDRLSTTVLGDSVNLASRIEGLTKHYGCRILISGDTLASVNDRKAIKYREIDWLRVKGKSKPVVIYEVCNADPSDVWKIKKEAGKFIKQGLMSRHMQEWYVAISCFTKALAAYPQDKAAMFHIEQIYRLMHRPLGENWDGAIDPDRLG